MVHGRVNSKRCGGRAESSLQKCREREKERKEGRNEEVKKEREGGWARKEEEEE